MKERIEQLLADVRGLNCKTAKDVEEARVRLLGKKERSPSFSRSSGPMARNLRGSLAVR